MTVTHCPACGYLLEAATCLENRSPEPGDLSICYECTEILCFDFELRAVPATITDLMNTGEFKRRAIGQLQAAIRINKRPV